MSHHGEARLLIKLISNISIIILLQPDISMIANEVPYLHLCKKLLPVGIYYNIVLDFSIVVAAKKMCHELTAALNNYLLPDNIVC